MREDLKLCGIISRDGSLGGWRCCPFMFLYGIHYVSKCGPQNLAYLESVQ